MEFNCRGRKSKTGLAMGTMCAVCLPATMQPRSPKKYRSAVRSGPFPSLDTMLFFCHMLLSWAALMLLVDAVTPACEEEEGRSKEFTRNLST